ncbi:MAG: acetyl-CoA carboxylase biotin carboxylase subunit [Chlamydiae bacterium SM23_39]|nr:MAG: acetyl-CoA carboxylase biotin carboxylase subunit [Chlamydiae bacterium SM23_39]
MKVLIAGRGEIALRIIRACKDLGLETVAVYSEADAKSLHVALADEALCIGKAHPQDSYLKIPAILSACEITGADAIHPGYGFLSESSSFASICESCGITFIGPNHKSISLLGDKANAKEIAKKVKCPIILGSEGVVPDIDSGLKIAKKLGFPVYIKAAGGGGGKGIRIAFSDNDFTKKFVSAQAEAGVVFNNSDVYLEKVIKNPRHIEVQIVGDKFGNYVHLGERDCSIQRRRQKLIEEAFSPKITPVIRKKIGQAAINVVKAAGYSSVGTVEFLLDENFNFYFMEVNTRIQVEHPITEEISGIDLVKEQIKIAQNKKLSYKQKDIFFKGHCFEFRINAEDPENNFSPSPGKLEQYFVPGGPNIRIDGACYQGYEISPFYDSLIAKLIVKGKDRKEAIDTSKRALREFHIEGIKSTIQFYLQLLEDKKFVAGDYSVNYIDEHFFKEKN